MDTLKSTTLDSLVHATYDKNINHHGDKEPSGQNIDSAFDGLELSQYAHIKGITPENVWDKIKSGQVVARCYQGKLLILDDFDFKRNPEEQVASTEQIIDAINLPINEPVEIVADPVIDHTTKLAEEREEQNVSPQKSPSALIQQNELSAENLYSPPEITLLLDHLSLAKEENKEILKLTQDAISHITEMTGTMMELKDELLKIKDQQIESFKSEADQNTRQIKQLKQEIEDLKMLSNMVDESEASD